MQNDDSIATMQKRSERSLVFLVIGLLFLAGSVAFSLIAVHRLEAAFKQKTSAIEAQDLYDDLSKKVKNWALIIQKQNVENMGQAKDEWLTQNARNQIEAAKDSVLMQTLKSDDITQVVRTLVENIAVLLDSQAELNYDLLNAIDENLQFLSQHEKSSVVKHSNLVIGYINNLIVASLISLGVAGLLIILFVRARKRDDSEKTALIEKLNDLKNAAEVASQLKSKFLSTVSHEIRTPLNGIIGISDILIQSSSPTTEKTLAKTINQSGKTLLRIINDILDFSKIEAGKIDLENAKFSVLEVLNQVLLTLAPKSAEKSLNLNYEIGTGLPTWVYGDSERLAQVLFNLVGNAIKFTQVGSVVVRVTCETALEEDKKKIEFTVTDTGVGMSDRDVASLFEPFIQVRRIGTSGEPGTGLGLSISQSIVKAMGGEIKVLSSVGRGSTFQFSLDFFDFSSEEVVSPPTFRATGIVEDSARIEQLNYNYMPRVLVVEDNPTNQIVAQSMLNQLGVEVVLSSNGQDALKILASSQIDLVLMDCQMPILDGFETTKSIRNNKNSVPIIAMTANAFNDDEEKCRRMGMDDFISKPVDIFLLREKLLRHLPARRNFTSLPLHSLDTTVGVAARKRVVRTFLATIAEFKETVNKAIVHDDVDVLHRVGHRFKVAADTVGGSEFHQYCALLEETQSVSEIAILQDEIFGALLNLERQLQNYQ